MEQIKAEADVLFPSNQEEEDSEERPEQSNRIPCEIIGQDSCDDDINKMPQKFSKFKIYHYIALLLFIRFVDKDGYQYRKKLPIYENSLGVKKIRYICTKCNTLIHYDTKEKKFFKTQKAKHNCNIGDHAISYISAKLEVQYLKLIEESINKVFIYIFYNQKI